MPKISPLGQKLWPTGREQTHTHTDTQTDRQTEKVKTEDPFFRKNFFLIFSENYHILKEKFFFDVFRKKILRKNFLRKFF